MVTVQAPDTPAAPAGRTLDLDQPHEDSPIVLPQQDPTVAPPPTQDGPQQTREAPPSVQDGSEESPSEADLASQDDDQQSSICSPVLTCHPPGLPVKERPPAWVWGPRPRQGAGPWVPRPRPPPRPKMISGFHEDDVNPLTQWELDSIIKAEEQKHKDTGSSNASLRDGIEYIVDNARERKKNWEAENADKPEFQEQRRHYEEAVEKDRKLIEKLRSKGRVFHEVPMYERKVSEWMLQEELEAAGIIEKGDKKEWSQSFDKKEESWRQVRAEKQGYAPVVSGATAPAPVEEGPSTAAKVGSAGAIGVAALALSTLGGIWLYKRIKEKMDAKTAKGKAAGKPGVKRRHVREWVPSDD